MKKKNNTVKYKHDDKEIVLVVEEDGFYKASVIFPDGTQSISFNGFNAVDVLLIAQQYANAYSTKCSTKCEVCLEQVDEGYKVDASQTEYYCSDVCLKERYFILYDNAGGMFLYEMGDGNGNNRLNENIEFSWMTF